MDIKKEIPKIISWMQEEVKRANAKGVLIAVSGGIDSAVVAHLAKRAFPENSLATWLSIESSKKFRRNALRIFEETKITIKDIDLGPTYHKMIHNLRLEDASEKTKGNVKARLRMTTAYAFANELNYLVLGSSNKSEIYLGYFSKWGDGASDLQPLAQFYKSEVYQLAHELNVNQRVIDTPPSADLWDNQTDEDDLGFTYQDVEKHLKGEKIDQETSKKIESLHKRNKHKLNLSNHYKKSLE